MNTRIFTAAAVATLAVASLGGCAPDAWQNYKATGFNDYLNVVQAECQPLWIGDMYLPSFRPRRCPASPGASTRCSISRPGCTTTAARRRIFARGADAGVHVRRPAHQPLDRLHDREAACRPAAYAAGRNRALTRCQSCPSTGCGRYGAASAALSSSDSATSSAFTASSSCHTWLAPTIGAVTPGRPSSHA